MKFFTQSDELVTRIVHVVIDVINAGIMWKERGTYFIDMIKAALHAVGQLNHQIFKLNRLN